MAQNPIRNVNDFLLSTYFADGVRITIGVLSPPLILAQFGLFNMGMALSLGALIVSVVDSPGPIVHRRNAMAATIILTAIFATLTGLTNQNVYFIGIVFIASCFLFSMLLVYGNRAASVGTAVLLVMVLSIDDLRPWKEVLSYSGLLVAGGTWYALLSYLVYRIRPYLMVQQALSESIHEVSNFLRTKAKFYNSDINYKENFDELLELQVKVHEKQEIVREMLFKTREIVHDSTPAGRFLLLVFVDTVDLFEQVMSTYYNYRKLHEEFDKIGILKHYETILLKSADALDEIAWALKTGGEPEIKTDIGAHLLTLQEEISVLEANQTDNQIGTLGVIALKNIGFNIENILARIKTIDRYFNKEEKRHLKSRKVDVNRFITNQDFDSKLFFDNLTFKSFAFRHAMRVSIAMLIGLIVGRFINFTHTYWILLTILVISKPGFSLTKQRNYERIIGTVVGGFIGMAALVYIQDRNSLFIVLLICMVGSYSFQRKNYVVSVVFLTPYTLIIFDFLGMGSIALASERIYDTLIGCGIAFGFSYFLFPNWEYTKLKDGMLAVLKANRDYFEQITFLYFDKSVSTNQYKVARKEVYVTTSNLASLFQRMLSEPKSKQFFVKELHQFTSLNHQLSSYIATLSLYVKDHDFKFRDVEKVSPISNNTLYLFDLANNQIENPTLPSGNVPLIRNKNSTPSALTNEEISILEQFELVQTVVYDILKLSEKIKI